MATLENAFQINGVIDTTQSVLNNLNTLCTASGCWLSYDVTQGLWSVVINAAGTSIKSFDDSNIIGNINISGSGINELYNAVSIEFPHKDLRDQTDYVDLEIPATDKYPNEVDNTLNMSLQCINNPVQAQYIATVELNQSRLDKIIEFRTDYTAIGLKAGDIIDVTSEMYGFVAKPWRIVSLVESDAEDGSIQISITALEYSDSVYDNSNLIQTERNKKTGIVPKSQNTALTDSDDAAGMFAATKTYVFDFAADLFILDTTTPDYKPYDLGYSYVVEYTGMYVIDYINNWGGDVLSDKPYLGVYHRSCILVSINGAFYTDSLAVPELVGSGSVITGLLIGTAGTGGAYEPFFVPHALRGFIPIRLNAGDVVSFWVAAGSDYPHSYPEKPDPLSFTPPPGDEQILIVSGSLRLVGR